MKTPAGLVKASPRSVLDPAHDSWTTAPDNGGLFPMRLPSREQCKTPFTLTEAIRRPLSMSPCVGDENEAMRRMEMRKVV